MIKACLKLNVINVELHVYIELFNYWYILSKKKNLRGIFILRF